MICLGRINSKYDFDDDVHDTGDGDLDGHDGDVDDNETEKDHEWFLLRKRFMMMTLRQKMLMALKLRMKIMEEGAYVDDHYYQPGKKNSDNRDDD